MWEATARLQECRLSGVALMPHSKGALQSISTSEQEASTGLKIHCAEKDEMGWKSQRFCFSARTENRQSKVSAPHTAGCQLRFPAKINKRLSGFSLCYQSHARQATRWQQTVLDMNIFCFWCILLKSCGISFPKAIITYHVHYQMTTNETPVSWLLETRILQGQKTVGLKFRKVSQA